MKKHNLNDYLTRLNKLLEEHNFIERFVDEKFMFEGNEYDKIVLYNLADKQKTIEFMFDERSDSYILFYLSTHEHFDDDDFGYYKTTEKLINIIFDTVKAVLENKIIGYGTKEYRDGMIGGTISFFADVNSFEYGQEERDYLTKYDMEFELWSGVVTENMKFFAISHDYKPEIIKKYEEYLETGGVIWDT